MKKIFFAIAIFTATTLHATKNDTVVMYQREGFAIKKIVTVTIPISDSTEVASNGFNLVKKVTQVETFESIVAVIAVKDTALLQQSNIDELMKTSTTKVSTRPFIANTWLSFFSLKWKDYEFFWNPENQAITSSETEITSVFGIFFFLILTILVFFLIMLGFVYKGKDFLWTLAFLVSLVIGTLLVTETSGGGWIACILPASIIITVCVLWYFLWFIPRELSNPEI